MDRMDRNLAGVVRNFPGTISVYAKNLDTGKSFALRADDRVRTASTIKLPIMVAVFQSVAEGKAQWSDTIVLRDQDKVSGSGVLRELSEGVALPLRDLVHLMIVVSDNTATNLLLSRFGADSVNERMEALGLKNTRSLRKIRGDGNALKEPEGWSEEGRKPGNERYGIGYSTPREMAMLLEMIESGKVVSPEASRQMIAILERQQFKDGIGRQWRLKVASKSGALDTLRSDAGIVYTKRGRVAIAITVDGMREPDWSPDNEGNKAIARITGHLLEGLTQ